MKPAKSAPISIEKPANIKTEATANAQARENNINISCEAATRLVHYAAWRKDNNQPHHREAAMAKLFATERATEICDKATRILGSYGYAMEFTAQRYFRDIRFTLYGGGTSEILKTIIAKDMTAQ